MSRTRTNSPLATRPTRGAGKPRCHKVPMCAATGLPRFRDRHQARDAARAITVGSASFTAHTYPCIDCGGHHIEKSTVLESRAADIAAAPIHMVGPALAPSLTASTRRYVLVDIENLTQGGKSTREEAARIWGTLHGELLGITDRDHVVVGAALGVHRKYRSVVQGLSTKWVLGAAGPDGADRALLTAIDIVRVARNYDELVIASGDHAFVALAAHATQLGLSVHVVHVENSGQRTSLARDLAEVATARTLIRSDLRIISDHKLAARPTSGNWARRIHSAAARWTDHSAAA